MSGFCCLAAQFAAEHEGGDRKGEDIGGGLRHPCAVEAEYRRKDEQARDEEDNLPREAEEYGDARLAYGLEVVRYHNLRPDEHVHAHENAYGVGCQGSQFGVVVEAQGHLPGEEFAAQPAEGGYGRGRDDAVAQRLAHAVGAADKEAGTGRDNSSPRGVRWSDRPPLPRTAGRPGRMEGNDS